MNNHDYYNSLKSLAFVDEQVNKDSRHYAAAAFLYEADAFLDIGCWSGIMLKIAEKYFKEIYGFDIIVNPLLETNSRYSVHTGDIDSDGLHVFSNDSIDVITCLDTIEHVYDPINLVGEVQRVLKPGGRAIFSSPNIRQLNHLYQLLIKGRFPKTSNELKGYDGGHLHYFTHGDLHQIFQSNSFRNIRTKGLRDTVGKYTNLKKFLSRCSNLGFVKEFFCGGILLVAEK